jgi:predicted dinucleotide-binding enzyme
MRIGIIGSGRIGGTLGLLWARAGHEVLFSGSHSAAKLRALADEAGPAARVGTPREAAAFGDVVVLATPWWERERAAREAGGLDGKVVIDTGNPYREGWVPYRLPADTSSGEETAEHLPGARVVKAFNTLQAGVLASAPTRGERDRLALFYAGDDTEAKRAVATLIADAGFEPVDVGSLHDGRLLDHGSPLHNHPMRAADGRALLARLETAGT